MGSKAPAFSTDSKSFTFDRETGQGFALLCLAQGFPVPAFRQVKYKPSLFPKLDPMGSKAPAFATNSKISSYFMQSGLGLTLLCQAQGFPVPLYRYE
jgi:hypothetical protein